MDWSSHDSEGSEKSSDSLLTTSNETLPPLGKTVKGSTEPYKKSPLVRPKSESDSDSLVHDLGRKDSSVSISSQTSSEADTPVTIKAISPNPRRSLDERQLISCSTPKSEDNLSSSPET